MRRPNFGEKGVLRRRRRAAPGSVVRRSAPKTPFQKVGEADVLG